VLEQASNDFLELKSLVREAELTNVFDISTIRSRALNIQTRWMQLETLNVNGTAQNGMVVSRPFGLETFVQDVEAYLLAGALSRLRLVLGAAIKAEDLLRSLFPNVGSVYELIEDGMLSGIQGATQAATTLNKILIKLTETFPQLGSVISDTRDIDRYLRALDTDFPKLMMTIAPEAFVGGSFSKQTGLEFIQSGNVIDVTANAANALIGPSGPETVIINGVVATTFAVTLVESGAVLTLNVLNNGPLAVGNLAGNAVVAAGAGCLIERGETTDNGTVYILTIAADAAVFTVTPAAVVGSPGTFVTFQSAIVAAKEVTMSEVVYDQDRFIVGPFPSSWILGFIAHIDQLKMDGQTASITAAINTMFRTIAPAWVNVGPVVLHTINFWTVMLKGLRAQIPAQSALFIYKTWFRRVANFVNSAASDSVARKFIADSFDY
jgi:hypothetical protein